MAESDTVRTTLTRAAELSACCLASFAVSLVLLAALVGLGAMIYTLAK